MLKSLRSLVICQRNINSSIRNHKDLQVYIQTPYKTEVTLQNLLETLDGRDLLSVAMDIGSTNQEVITDSIKGWRNRQLPNLKKRPAVFSIKCR